MLIIVVITTTMGTIIGGVLLLKLRVMVLVSRKLSENDEKIRKLFIAFQVLSHVPLSSDIHGQTMGLGFGNYSQVCSLMVSYIVMKI